MNPAFDLVCSECSPGTSSVVIDPVCEDHICTSCGLVLDSFWPEVGWGEHDRLGAPADPMCDILGTSIAGSSRLSRLAQQTEGSRASTVHEWHKRARQAAGRSPLLPVTLGDDMVEQLDLLLTHHTASGRKPEAVLAACMLWAGKSRGFHMTLPDACSWCYCDDERAVRSALKLLESLNTLAATAAAAKPAPVPAPTQKLGAYPASGTENSSCASLATQPAAPDTPDLHPESSQATSLRAEPSSATLAATGGLADSAARGYVAQTQATCIPWAPAMPEAPPQLAGARSDGYDRVPSLLNNLSRQLDLHPNLTAAAHAVLPYASRALDGRKPQTIAAALLMFIADRAQMKQLTTAAMASASGIAPSTVSKALKVLNADAAALAAAAAQLPGLLPSCPMASAALPASRKRSGAASAHAGAPAAKRPALPAVTGQVANANRTSANSWFTQVVAPPLVASVPVSQGSVHSVPIPQSGFQALLMAPDQPAVEATVFASGCPPSGVEPKQQQQQCPVQGNAPYTLAPAPAPMEATVLPAGQPAGYTCASDLQLQCQADPLSWGAALGGMDFEISWTELLS